MLRLFRYKAWANDNLLGVLAQLQDVRLTDLAVRALNHSYIVDRIFAAHMRRTPHIYTSANPVELPLLADLAEKIRDSDQEYINYVAALDRDQIKERLDFVLTDGALGHMSREEMLLHVINHGTGHRGQVSALMLLNALPPAKDGLTTYLHLVEASARRGLT